MLEAGPVDGPVVLALHGVGARADRWAPAMPAFASAGFRFMAIDLPGHGLATKSAAVDCTASGMTQALAKFCRAIVPANTKIFVLGTSLGALYAAALGLAEPDLVGGIVLVGALGLEPLGADGRARISSSIARTSRDDVAKKLEGVMFDRSLVTDALVSEETRMNSSPGASEALAAYAKYFATDIDRDAVGDRLASVDLPTMLIWGEHDRGVPIDVGLRAHQRIARSHFATIKDAGHAPYYERPEEFCAPVALFLEGLL